MSVKIYLQNCITRDHDMAPRLARFGLDLVQLDHRPDADTLSEHDVEAGQALLPSPVFCSLQLGGYINRRLPGLARGLDMPLEALMVSRYASVLPPGILLNPHGMFLPWGQVCRARDLIGKALGPRLFLRPDRGTKPFTGFQTTIDQLEFEISAHTQTDHVDAGEMVWICPARDLPEHEFRVWIVAGTPVTWSSYSWVDGAGSLSVPKSVIEAASSLGRMMEYHCRSFVADFVMISTEPKLVELNAISTSGWYPDMDPASLIGALIRDLS